MTTHLPLAIPLFVLNLVSCHLVQFLKRELMSHSKAIKSLQAFNVAPVSSDVVVGKRCDSLLNIPNEPLFLGEDFAALLKVPNIPNKESVWVDLWIPIRAGDKVIPLDAQYLSSLRSFLGLRYLKMTGMLKSYQKRNLSSCLEHGVVGAS